MIPWTVRSDIERAVAEALNLTDLRRGVEALLPQVDVLPSDPDEVDLVVMWVWLNCSGRWPAAVRDRDGIRPLIDGCVVAAIQALDLADGRDPTERPLTPSQRSRLETWEAQSRTEDRCQPAVFLAACSTGVIDVAVPAGLLESTGELRVWLDRSHNWIGTLRSHADEAPHGVVLSGEGGVSS